MKTDCMLEYPAEYTSELQEMVDIDNVCVVYGETGRTMFILSSYPGTVVYDAREILEPRNLGGMYVVKEGSIVYLDGLLVGAMERGAMLCFKRIDQNPTLLQYLRPVLRERRIVGTDGRVVVAHPDFRLFLTAAEPFPLRNAHFIGPIRFRREAVLEWFGEMRKSVSRVLAYVAANRSQRCLADRGSSCKGICVKHGEDCRCDDELLCGTHFRELCSLKEFLLRLKEPDGLEASNANRCLLYQGVVNIVLKHDSPLLSEFLLAVLPDLELPNLLLARTEPVLSVLRSLLHNIRVRRPTLLVGETGAGKTALVQYLSDNSEFFFGQKQPLKVINMSSDFDSAALIGGYQSVNFDVKLRELCTDLGMKVPTGASRKAHFDCVIEHCKGRRQVERNNEALKRIQEEAEASLRMLNGKLAFYYREGVLIHAMRTGGWLLLDEVNLAPEETLGLLEALLSKGNVTVHESGDAQTIPIHPDFMVFACMNPFGDYGKKRYDSNSFNRLVFHDFSGSKECVRAVVRSVSRNMLGEAEALADFYFEFKKALVARELSNIVEPLVSGRTLCRAIGLIMQLRAEGDEAAVFHAVNLLFFTQLDLCSRAQAIALYRRYLPMPPAARGTDPNEGKGDGFIVTPKVKIHMNDVELAVKAGLPVLLQGDTSTGKTSLVTALARKHGSRIYRVNNHEHTDTADYIGSYTTTADGIVFKEGVLLTALRNGSWLLLDELNLAPSDVLEVLNRLLDDNREIYVPEIDTVIKPHKNFQIFATQNLNYAGRRGLAKSLRNRFVEVFFYEKDEAELRMILERRSGLPAGFAKLMMEVYMALRTVRTVNSLMTLRDLFRWANRQPRSYYEVYETGLDMLSDSQRTEADRERVREVFNSVFETRMASDHKDYRSIHASRYTRAEEGADMDEYNNGSVFHGVTGERFAAVTSGLVLTRSYVRLIDSIYRAWQCYEPVLLVGETGIGKTRLCAIVAELFRTELRTVNMHSGSECADFVGHSELRDGKIEWRDGVLVRAMTAGNALLIDEINLAEDAVLERLNSVLEERRSVYVPETAQEIVADDRFRIVATMNPGGDYGKRELSPALRNRFTEIYFELETEERYEIFSNLLERAGVPLSDAEYYTAECRKLSSVPSIRRMEMLTRLIQNVTDVQHSNDGLCLIEPITGRTRVWADALELLSCPGEATAEYCETNEVIGVAPYFLRKRRQSIGQNKFCFNTASMRKNLQRIIRGLTLGSGVLLIGEPGVGKTSIVQSIARALGIGIVRINLSEETELCDLVGAHLPVGNTIRFVESEMVAHIRNGQWVILDEINLCTQSVIEGLNSMLDHRRVLVVNDMPVRVHADTRIFGTMNPVNQRNGRKCLPKSFLDRFVIVEMAEYSSEDIQAILATRYGELFYFDPQLSIRGNIKANELISVGFEPNRARGMFDGVKEELNKAKGEHDSTNGELNGIKGGLDSIKCEPNNTNAKFNNTGGNFDNTEINLINNQNELGTTDSTFIHYKITDKCLVGGVSTPCRSLLESYVFLHAQIPQIETALRCLKAKLPFIIVGDIGCGPLLSFLATLFGLRVVPIDCHAETDTGDLLGQYQSARGSDCLFEWRDSQLVEALQEGTMVIFNLPELVDKPLFDRLSALFESERALSIYEKGINTKIDVNPNARIVLRCDDPLLLSPALLDRCVLIRLSNAVSFIDAYKIFHPPVDALPLPDPSAKRHRGMLHNDRLREIARTDQPFDGCILEHAARRFHVKGTLPSCINTVIPITNALLQSRIEALFSVELYTEVPLDHALLSSYRRVAAYAVPTANDPAARIRTLQSTTALNAWLKCIEYTDDAYCSIPCSTAPSTIVEYKECYIKSIKHKQLADLEAIAYFADAITGIGEVQDIDTDWEYELPACDPLLIVKKELENDKAREHNRLQSSIAQTAMLIYKYGKQQTSNGASTYEQLTSLFAEYDKSMANFAELLISLDKKLARDYGKFRDVVSQITFCDYFRTPQLRKFLEDFTDIFDHQLAKLFKAKKCCQRCSGNPQGITSKDVALRLIRNGEYINSTAYEYSRYLYNLATGKICSPSRLIFESICFETPLSPEQANNIAFSKLANFNHGNSDLPLKFTDSEINECLRSIVPTKTVAQVVETRENRILIGKDYRHHESVAGLGIFSSPETLIEKLHAYKAEAEHTLAGVSTELGNSANMETERHNEETADDVLAWLTSLYKNASCLTIDRNYRYFSYLLHTSITASSLEPFFMGCAMFEYVDRMHFAQMLMRVAPSDHLYNIILQYKAFALEELHARKTKECKAKLFKEPRMYESTIHTYVDRLLYIPVTALLNIKFDRPVCQEEHHYNGPNFLLSGYSAELKEAPRIKESCECSSWVSLALKHSKDQISAVFAEHQPVTRELLVHRFYNRKPEGNYNYAEICLAKVFNTIQHNINKQYYDKQGVEVVLRLLKWALDYPFPPFLFFIFKFADTNQVDVEDGVALKSGEGAETMNEQIKEEDICDDVDANNDNGNDADSNAIDMDNEGELHSENEESKADESGVDDKDNSGEKQDEDYEERGATEYADGLNEAEQSEEAVEEADQDENEEALESASDDEGESSIADSADNTNEVESSSGETCSDQESNQEDVGNAEDETPRVDDQKYSTYEWAEAKMNREQTCENADGYDRKVQGGSLDEKDALAEGEGEEAIEGEGETGKGAAYQNKVVFPSDTTDCARLVELLRVVLASNKNSKYKGDYKTGKKLNLKKIIPYIASDYRKDKIWMKRQKSDKKTYTIRLFIDNSKSMFDQQMVNLLAAVYYKLSRAFSMLGVAVELYRFGETLHECTINDLTFTDESTSIAWIDDFVDGINIILTDGVFQTAGSRKDNFLAIMIDKGSIRKMSKVSVIENKVFIQKYLDTFALQYCIIDDVMDLEQAFIEALRNIITNLL